MQMRSSIIIVILISMLLGFASLTRGHDWGDDFASYIMQAQSISNGSMKDFVQRNSFTVFESSIQIGPAAYPWGYPLILLPALWIRGVHPIVLKLPGLFFLALFLISLYRLTMKRFTRTESLLFVSLFAFNPIMVGFVDQILSDIPFLFFSTLVLSFALIDEQTRTVRVLTGVLSALAFSIRTQGLLILGACVLVELLNMWKSRSDRVHVLRSVRSALELLGGFALIFIPYVLIFPGGSESYLAQYETFQISILSKNILAYGSEFGSFFGDGGVWLFIYLVAVVFFFIGAWIRREHDTVLHVFFIAWMLALITWPYFQGVRFIFPVLPVFLYFTFWGMKYALSRFAKQRAQSMQTGFTIYWSVIALALLFTTAARAYTNIKDDRAINGPFDPYSDELFNYIREGTPSDSVIVFFKPRAMRLFTGRDSIMRFDCEGLALGDYVALHRKWDNSQVMPADVDECGVPLEQVYRSQRFLVYRVLE